MSDLYIKTKIRSGSTSLDYLKKYEGRRALVICDRFMVESGAVSHILSALGETNRVEVFDRVVPDPTASVVGDGLAVAVRLKPDVVIGFGGGSSIDTAKGVIYFSQLRGLFAKPEFIAIPTTSGTGSEVTNATVITDEESRSKHLIADDEILADVALLNPLFTCSVPPSVTANTGMDVMTHALEAYVAKNGNVFSDALAEKAVELTLKSLLTCYLDGKNGEARKNMQEASTLAGMAFNVAGLGANHSIAHQLGGTFHIPHGLANAVLLRAVIEYNAADHAVMAKYAEMAYKVKLAGVEVSPRQAVNALEKAIEMMMKYMGMPCSISEMKVERGEYESQIDNMAANALCDYCLKTTPAAIGKQEIKDILMKVYLPQ